MKDKELREEVKQLTALVKELGTSLSKFLEIEAMFHTQLQIFLELNEKQGNNDSHDRSGNGTDQS